jgi:polar amino acid transport system permease protein
MNKQKRPILENKSIGHIISIFLFVCLAYGYYYAATTKMSYSWNWNSIFKYFFYEDDIRTTATYNGYVSIKDDVLIVNKDDESSDKETLQISLKEYETLFHDGDYAYEGELLGNKYVWKKGPITDGLIVTVQISILSMILAFSIGVLLAIMRLSKIQFLKDIATVYINVVRGTPLLVQISLFYFIIASPIFKLDSFYSGTISLGMFFGAYIAEVLRGAIQSIDKGQSEAAKSLGMNSFQTMTLIIIPQALKRALPTLINEIISLVKDSSLVSAISVTELTKTGRDIQSSSFAAFEVWITIAVLYLSVTSILSFIGSRIEAKMKRQGGM